MSSLRGNSWKVLPYLWNISAFYYSAINDIFAIIIFPSPIDWLILYKKKKSTETTTDSSVFNNKTSFSRSKANRFYRNSKRWSMHSITMSNAPGPKCNNLNQVHSNWCGSKTYIQRSCRYRRMASFSVAWSRCLQEFGFDMSIKTRCRKHVSLHHGCKGAYLSCKFVLVSLAFLMINFVWIYCFQIAYLSHYDRNIFFEKKFYCTSAFTV